MISSSVNQQIALPQGKKIYFASDFHLGVPDYKSSLVREKKIVAWLNFIAKDAFSIYLLGDVFDFWFEYKYSIPKGFIRLQGKLAELSDSGINIHMFTGNHDMWMFDYFPSEFNITVFREPQKLIINNRKFLIGHGDGLGKGEAGYKLLKRIFTSKVCQWLFARLHPNLGIGIANKWSKNSRITSSSETYNFMGEKERLLNYCKELENSNHHDYYIFGHRHLPMEIKLNENCFYINLGDWVNFSKYGEFDGQEFKLLNFEK